MSEAIEEPKRKLTKKEQSELKIQRGKEMLAEIEKDFRKTLVVFFRSLVDVGDINAENIEDLLLRHFTKDKDRQNFRDRFDDLIVAKEKKKGR